MDLKIIYFNPNNFFWAVDDKAMKNLALELLDNHNIKVANEGVISEIRKLILEGKLDYRNIVIQWVREDLDRIDVLHFNEDSTIKDWPLDFCSMSMRNAQAVLKLMVEQRRRKKK